MEYRVQIREGEQWWGGATDKRFCPLTRGSKYHQDFRISGGGNQAMPLFVSTNGRYIWSDTPFAVDIVGDAFVLEGENIEVTEAGTTLRDAYTAAQAAHFPCDKKVLPRKFFRTAQYNTWMEFTYYPTQEGVMEYARKWLEQGYAPGIFIIDEGWHQNTAYGQWEFDFARFPDPKKMVDELHEMGYTVMLWVVPFVSCNGPAFVRALRPLVGTDPESAKHIFLRNEEGEVLISKWWNGFCATLNLNEPYDEKFLDDQLQHLQKDYGIDGFKFDGGSYDAYAEERTINGPRAIKDTAALNIAWNEFGRRYAYHEYKDTYMGGGKNVIQRLRDRGHRWDGDGICDLIPCALCAGLIGHPFLCPDMIGGGEWTYNFLPGFTVDQEVFVRMAQCSALFPMMQFSWAPWRALDEHHAKLCLDAAKLHQRMADDIEKLVTEAEQTGEPIMRTLEYNDPHQGFAEITDQFMLGEDILVAPVVTQGTVRREVAFPEGTWVDEDGREYAGRSRQMLDAPLEKLLWFRRK